MQEFSALDVPVYALSYDEADALSDFRDAHNVTFTLLSDPQSEVIRSFGILNTLIDESDHPWFGIPYPGTYILNAEGVVTHKFFDSNLAVRAGPEQLLRAVQGKSLLDNSPVATQQVHQSDVEVDISFEGAGLAVVVQNDLVVRFKVPEGRHVYADPAPAGSIAANIVLDESEALVERPIVRPVGTSHQLVGTSDRFQVYNDQFELRLPLTMNKPAANESGNITIGGEVCWQACDDEVCDVPVRKRFELSLPVILPPPVAIGSEPGAKLEPNAMAHFQKMTSRRTEADD